MLFGFASALSAASAGPLWAAPVAAPFIHLLALQLFAIGFALFGRLCWSDFDAGAIFSAGAFCSVGAFCCVIGAPAFAFVFMSCAQAAPTQQQHCRRRG